MSEWKADATRHKYDPLPDDGPRHKKRTRKRRVKSDHRHEYEDVVVDTHSYAIRRGGRRVREVHVCSRCKSCGRIGDKRCFVEAQDVPQGLTMYEVDNFLLFVRMKTLPPNLEVME